MSDTSVVVIPRLTTKRLLLREFRTSDFDAYAAHLADPLATVHMPAAADRRTAWRLFSAAVGTWGLTGAGWWAVEHLETGACLGVVGAFFREMQLDRLENADLEVGWSIFRANWRQGFASEAAAAALAWGFEHFASPRAIAYIAEENVASIGVSRRLGMHFDGATDFYGEPSNRYAIDRPRR